MNSGKDQMAKRYHCEWKEDLWNPNRDEPSDG